MRTLGRHRAPHAAFPAAWVRQQSARNRAFAVTRERQPSRRGRRYAEDEYLAKLAGRERDEDPANIP